METCDSQIHNHLVSDTSLHHSPVVVEEPLIEVATRVDLQFIKPIVETAYSKYIERLGMLPAAMNTDYDKLIEMQSLYVLRLNGALVGSICLSRLSDSMMISNLVVDPRVQGRGLGRLLMRYAEEMALEEGLKTMSLFANEKMYENIALYTRLGYVETGRKTEDGFKRVYFQKALD